jgi:hypothetical protein
MPAAFLDSHQPNQIQLEHDFDPVPHQAFADVQLCCRLGQTAFAEHERFEPTNPGEIREELRGLGIVNGCGTHLTWILPVQKNLFRNHDTKIRIEFECSRRYGALRMRKHLEEATCV